MQGLHLTADLYRCGCDIFLLIDEFLLAAQCREHTLASGLTLLAEHWSTFPEVNGEPGGVTGMLLLAESHLAVHTWPERGGVTLDVYVCNFNNDNSAKAERLLTELLAVFQAGDSEVRRIWRGGLRPGEEMLEERLTPDAYFGLRAARRLETRQTPYQRLEVLETRQFGKALRLDGAFMTSEGEEFFYHEALIHPAAIAHPQPQQALIVGGGDGGAAEELLKHPSLERVVVAELDGEVVEVAKRHFATIHRHVFAEPRLELRLGDGRAFVQTTAERFDLLYLDLTDPETPADPLYSAEFFAEVRRVLAVGGMLVAHLGSPVFHAKRVRDIVGDLRKVFAVVRCYGLYIPLYGAYWGFAVASQTADPTRIEVAAVAARLAERHIGELQYYNADIHSALFALPNYYRALVT